VLFLFPRYWEAFAMQYAEAAALQCSLLNPQDEQQGEKAVALSRKISG